MRRTRFYTWAELEAFQLVEAAEGGCLTTSDQRDRVREAADRIVELGERIKNSRVTAAMSLAAEARAEATR